MFRSCWRRRTLVALLPVVAACGPSVKSQTMVSPASAAAVHASAPDLGPVPEQKVPVAPAEDPVLTLIAASDRHFKAGQTELEQGHVDSAKQEFNRAIDLLLESPYGGRAEPRIREYFD